MYSWIWRHLPGSTAVKLLQAVFLVAAVIAVLLFAPLPAVFTLVPAVRTWQIAGMPAIWWVLGLVAYPILYVLGRAFRVRAERIERDFADLLEHN